MGLSVTGLVVISEDWGIFGTRGLPPHDKGRDNKAENLGVNNDEDDEQEQVVLFVTQC